MKLYQNAASANCYKIRLALTQLELPFERVEINLLPPAERPAELLALNPAGRVPFLQVSERFGLPESGAILHYLAEGSALLPDGREERADVLRWMFFEQNLHEPNIATSRYWLKLSGRPEERAAVLPLWHANGVAVLETMDAHLSDHAFFAAGQYTIADIALYGYTHVADEGGFDLAPYGHLAAWMERVRNQPGHVPMEG